MIEAVKTTASAGELWLICVIAVACLAFWLGMVAWADRNPTWRGRNMPDMPGPVLGGMHVGGGRSVSPNRDAPPVLTDIDEEPYAVADFETQQAEPLPATAAAVGPMVPGQRIEQEQPPKQAGAVPDMPAQRTGDADRAERTIIGPADQDEDS